MPKPFSQAEIDPKCALETLRTLASHGFGDTEFSLVHHWGAKGKLTDFHRYCEGLIERKGMFRPGDNNHQLHLRLLFIFKHCNELASSTRGFNSLAGKALRAHPPIEKKAQ